MGTKISQNNNNETTKNKDKSYIEDIEVSSLTNQTKDDSDTSSITMNSTNENQKNYLKRHISIFFIIFYGKEKEKMFCYLEIFQIIGKQEFIWKKIRKQAFMKLCYL